MKINYKTPNKVIMDMKDYVRDLCEAYPFELNSNVNYPWNMRLFSSEEDQDMLQNE